MSRINRITNKENKAVDYDMLRAIHAFVDNLPLSVVSSSPSVFSVSSVVYSLFPFLSPCPPCSPWFLSSAFPLLWYSRRLPKSAASFPVAGRADR